jgi:hypothetical protein
MTGRNCWIGWGRCDVRQFRRGQIVEIVTVDRGRGEKINDHRRTPALEEHWRAIVLGPSAFALGWWVVKKLGGDRPSARRTYTVPEAEIRRVVR